MANLQLAKMMGSTTDLALQGNLIDLNTSLALIIVENRNRSINFFKLISWRTHLSGFMQECASLYQPVGGIDNGENFEELLGACNLALQRFQNLWVRHKEESVREQRTVVRVGREGETVELIFRFTVRRQQVEGQRPAVGNGASRSMNPRGYYSRALRASMENVYLPPIRPRKADKGSQVRCFFCR